MRAAAAVAATALPALALAALGSTHPAVLTPESAPWWRDLHVVGLVLFPLLALGPWAVARVSRPDDVLGWVFEGLAAVLGLVYAAFVRRTRRARRSPGAVVAVAGAWSFLTSHIYHPYGVATMITLGIGHPLLAVTATRKPPGVRGR